MIFALYLKDFDGGIYVFGIIDQCDTKIGLFNRSGSVTYISWASDFALCFEDYLMDEGHT